MTFLFLNIAIMLFGVLHGLSKASMLPIHFLLHLPSLRFTWFHCQYFVYISFQIAASWCLNPRVNIAMTGLRMCCPFLLDTPIHWLEHKVVILSRCASRIPVSLGRIGFCQYPSTMRRSLCTQTGLSKHSSMINSSCDPSSWFYRLFVAQSPNIEEYFFLP